MLCSFAFWRGVTEVCRRSSHCLLSLSSAEHAGRVAKTLFTPMTPSFRAEPTPPPPRTHSPPGAPTDGVAMVPLGLFRGSLAEQELICGSRRANSTRQAAAAVRAARGLVLLQDPQVTYFRLFLFLFLFYFLFVVVFVDVELGVQQNTRLACLATDVKPL